MSLIQSDPGTNGTISLKKFPSRTAVTYMIIQALTGLAISFFPFGDYQWIREFFEPIDHHFQAFRTMFSNAPDPTAGKVFLLVWWAFFIPWGVAWAGRFTGGFRPVHPAILQSKIAVVKLLLLTCLGLWMLIYLCAYADYGAVRVNSSDVPSRADIIPAFIQSGVFATSCWLALTSFVLVAAIATAILSFRALIQQNFHQGD